MQPSMVVTDIDGTLLPDNGIISDYTRDALAYIYHQLQVPVVLATGRPPRDVPEIIEQLDFNPLCICANGSVIYDSVKHDIELIAPLSAADIQYCVQIISIAIPEVGFAIEPPQLIATFYGDQNYIHPYNSNPRVVRVENVRNLYRPALKLLVSLSHSESHLLAERIAQILDYAYEISYFHTVGLIEIAKKGVNKATGLQYLSENYQLPAQYAIAFGDMNNDTEIIQSVWKGVAMANATGELLSLTPHHTLSNNADGIAHELSKYWPEIKRFNTITSEK